MLKGLRFFPLFALIASCIEPFHFVVKDPSAGLVVEAFLSDKSFRETVAYPGDGRRFTVRLTRTGDVTNTRAVPEKGAVVELMTSDGQVVPYSPTGSGVYSLIDNDFKALPGLEYKLRITLADESIYESAWEGMPAVNAGPMGEIGFREGEKQVYVMESGEWVIRTKKNIWATVLLPPNEGPEPVYYRWTYSPTWIFIAPLSPSIISPGYKCWAEDPYYLITYGVQADNAGGYRKDLFDLETVRNARIFEKLSVLVTQHVMTEPYFNFWKEMKERNERSGLTDTPPYNLHTNFTCLTGDQSVSGYFGVVREQARRWYFSRRDLSYHVENTLKADCESSTDPPAPECFDCREYSFGKVTNIQPVWWEK